MSPLLAASSFLLDPKVVLARKIATVLDEYLDLDTCDGGVDIGKENAIRTIIETGLTANDETVLRNTTVKRLRQQRGITGNIAEVIIAWRWNQRCTISEETVVTIRGAHIYVNLDHLELEAAAVAGAAASTTGTVIVDEEEARIRSDPCNTSSFFAWKSLLLLSSGCAKKLYWHQFLRTLRVLVQDLCVTVTMRGSPVLTLRVQEMGLNPSTGKTAATTIAATAAAAVGSNGGGVLEPANTGTVLQWLISLQTVRICTVLKEKELTLVKAFSYTAEVRYSSRGGDGDSSDEHDFLEIVSDRTIRTNGTSVLHLMAARPQLEALTPLWERICEIKTTTLRSSLLQGTVDCRTNFGTAEGGTMKETQPTIHCRLAIPSLQISLPDSSRINVDASLLSFSNSEFRITGSGGMSIDGYTLLEMAQDAEWCLDLMQCRCTMYATRTRANKKACNVDDSYSIAGALANISFDQKRVMETVNCYLEYKKYLTVFADLFNSRSSEIIQAAHWSIAVYGILDVAIATIVEEQISISFDNLSCGLPTYYSAPSFSYLNVNQVSCDLNSPQSTSNLIDKCTVTGLEIDSQTSPPSFHVRVQGMDVQSCSREALSLIVQPFQANIRFEAACYVISLYSTFHGRLSHSGSFWVDGSVAGLSCNLDSRTHLPFHTVVAGLQIDDSSCPGLKLSVPSLAINTNTNSLPEVIADGCIEISFGSISEAKQVYQTLFDAFPRFSLLLTNISGTSLISFRVQGFEWTLVDEKVRCVVGDLKSLDNGHGLYCEQLSVMNDGSSGAALACSRIRVCCKEVGVKVTVAVLESFYLPGAYSLVSPLNGFVFIYNLDGTCICDLPPITLLSLSEELYGQNTGTNWIGFNVPFPVRIFTKAITIRSSMAKLLSRVEEINVYLTPASRGVGFDIDLGTTRNGMIQIRHANISGVLDADKVLTVRWLRLKMEEAFITADISSSVSVSKLIQQQRTTGSVLVWSTPDCDLESISASILVKSKFASTETAFRVPSFKGAQGTTSSDLAEHLTKSIVWEAPSLYNNALVLGEHATDLTAKAAGRMAGTTVCGSALGSIGALILTDSVKSFLILGKESRGASLEDKICLSDCVLGVYQTARIITVRGGRLRRGGHLTYSYQVGDFFTGMSDSIGNYICENKSRFASAGFSVVTMALGGFAYGFTGMMVGNYVGGKAGPKLFHWDANPAKKCVSNRLRCIENEDDFILIQWDDDMETEDADTRNIHAQEIDGLLIVHLDGSCNEDADPSAPSEAESLQPCPLVAFNDDSGVLLRPAEEVILGPVLIPTWLVSASTQSSLFHFLYRRNHRKNQSLE
jgi:hypothetical protein